MGTINGFMALKWGLIGLLILVGVTLSLLSYFIIDIAQFLSGIPVPANGLDWLHLSTLLVIGIFLAYLGRQLGQRQEWGAFAAGLCYFMGIFYVAAIAFLFLQDPQALLPDANNDALYQRYFWLVWTLIAIVVLFLIAATWFLLGSPTRRDYYAQGQANIKNHLAKTTCPTCGLIAAAGQCPQCDIAAKEAHLIIAGQRQEHLRFTEKAPTFKIGRRADHSQAHIIISDDDGEHWARVSTLHAQIAYDFTKEKFTVTDMSKNGTYLNDDPQPLPSQRAHTLQSGDRLRLANAIELILEF